MIEFFNRDTNNDQWVVDLYKQKRCGFFVEAGALDGIHDSSTYTLEKDFDWHGILVEPLEAPFNALKYNRPKSICRNLCLSEEKSSVLFCECNETGYSGIKETLIRYDKLHVERYGKSRKEWEQAGYKEKIIEAVTLLELLKSANAPRIIHYIGLDLEGAEYDVLKDFPFEEYTILALSIEGDLCNDLMLSKGYRMVENPFNTAAPWEYYFLHKDFEKIAFGGSTL